jgi:hypothetical protein
MTEARRAGAETPAFFPDILYLTGYANGSNGKIEPKKFFFTTRSLRSLEVTENTEKIREFFLLLSVSSVFSVANDFSVRFAT